jgi:hypothetical protein
VPSEQNNSLHAGPKEGLQKWGQYSQIMSHSFHLYARGIRIYCEEFKAVTLKQEETIGVGTQLRGFLLRISVSVIEGEGIVPSQLGNHDIHWVL